MALDVINSIFSIRWFRIVRDPLQITFELNLCSISATIRDKNGTFLSAVACIVIDTRHLYEHAKEKCVQGILGSHVMRTLDTGL
jgi:hypothetical protein